MAENERTPDCENGAALKEGGGEGMCETHTA